MNFLLISRSEVNESIRLLTITNLYVILYFIGVVDNIYIYMI